MATEKRERQPVGFEFICDASECKHNDSRGGCLLNTMGNPVCLIEGGRCKKYEKR